MGPKFTISQAPTDTTCGILHCIAASHLALPAARTPPTISSHHSVVVKSSTPWKNPAWINASIVFPPVPVAWNTNTSYPLSSRQAFARSTHGVVTPNIVAATIGFVSSSSGVCSGSRLTMPAMARTAFWNMVFDILFNPATSTIDGIIIISLVPTYCATFPEAMVDTITLGTPIGSARIAGVTNDVPPEPPKEMIPSNFPASYNRGTRISIPFDNASVAIALSLRSAISLISYPAAAAISLFVTSASKSGANTPVWII